MTITTRDLLINALNNNASRLVIDKGSIANAVAGQLFSLWRATGVPGQGVLPTVAEICTKALVGAMGFNNQTLPSESVMGWLTMAASNNATNVEVVDRLAHIGGANGTLTTAQSGLALTGLPAARLGDANYSDVQWWLEWYVDTGATAVNVTVAVTYNDDTVGNLAVIALPASMRAGRLVPLISAVPGKFIKAVGSFTLSASTGTAGNFGVTATRARTAISCPIANKIEIADWAALGLPKIENDSCLQMVMLCSTSVTGTLRGQGKIAHG